MKQILKALAETLKDLGIKDRIPEGTNYRILGSILIALSGFLLYSDKVFSYLSISGQNTYGFQHWTDFVWVLTQSVAPIFMLLGYFFRPYFTSFLVPIYCYSIQIVWIFQPQYHFDNPFLHLFALGSCIFFVFTIIMIRKFVTVKKSLVEENELFVREVKSTLTKMQTKILEA